jgi:hypothetical protein
MAPQSAPPLMAPDATVMFQTLQPSMSGDRKRTVTCDLSTEPDANCVAGCRQWLLDQLMELQGDVYPAACRVHMLAMHASSTARETASNVEY